MKTHLTPRWAVITLVLALTGVCSTPAVHAQGGGYRAGNHTWPDSLILVTHTGVVRIDDSAARDLYFLDTDADGTADYHLSFGPWWYTPDGIDRPENNVTVTIVGVVRPPIAPSGLETLLVIELDGVTWRVPVEYGAAGWNAEPFWLVSDDALTATGRVFVDTTYYYAHYYLDTDGDTLPEYRLGFGPPWYEPASGAVRPEDGATVTVSGILHEGVAFDLLAVYVLDGLSWRESSQPAPWAGDWLRRARADSSRAFCMNQRQSWIDFPPGNFGPGMGGPNWPDSLFIQFWEIHPDSLPGPVRDRIFAGYHLEVHDRDRVRLMDGRFGGENGRMRFELQHQVRLRYVDDDILAAGLNEATVAVWMWDVAAEDWVEVAGVTVDPIANTLTFQTADLAGYYAIAADLTGVGIESETEQPIQIALDANYPNPFNPVTTIPYRVSTTQRIELAVFDALGRQVAVLVDEVQPAGAYHATFDARDLPSGVYLYRLRGAYGTVRREMVVLK